MRLIDIDKVVSDYKGKNKSLQKVTWFELTDYEVKAIPIEWIEKKAQEFLMNRNFRWATDFQEVVDMWKVENNIPLFDNELKITLGEKENEAN